jgi:hypothetical protein
MKQMNLKQWFTIVFLMLGAALIPLTSQAQTSLEIGVDGGFAYYNGDITPAKPFVQPKPAYGLLARYNFNDRWTVKAAYTQASITGSDSISKAVANRGLFFKTAINELSVTGEFNFWRYSTGSKTNKITPYLMGGGSFFLYTPKSSEGLNLRNAGTEGQLIGYENRKPYKSYSFAVIFGMGLKYSLTKKLGLAVEWGMRKTFTDYLDDVSTTYYQNHVVGLSDPTGTHVAGEQRGNSQNKDWYNFTLLSLTYKLDIQKETCNNLKW